MLQIVIYKFHILPTLCFIIVLKGLIFSVSRTERDDDLR